MKAIAVDDEPIALDIIKSHSSKVPFLDLIADFTDALSALDFLQQEEVDLIFLDIEMPDISGLEFFNSLQKKPLLIFTTAYSEHAVTGFQMDAVDYLLKPIPLERFMKSCNKAFELFQHRSIQTEDHVFIKDGYEQKKVYFEDILFIEAAGNYVTFQLRDNKILSRSTFREVLNFLPANKFMRVHRSFVISIDQIDKIERHQITIANRKIPLARVYREKLASALKK